MPSSLAVSATFFVHLVRLVVAARTLRQLLLEAPALLVDGSPVQQVTLAGITAAVNAAL